MNRSASMLSVLGLALSLGTVLMTLACGGTDVVSKGVQPVFSGSYDGSTNSVACYWEGTLRTDLAGGSGSVSSHAYSPSAYVQGYIYTPGTWTGSVDDGSKTYACYWTGSTRTDLTATGATGNTYATSLTLSGSDIYVGGFYTNSDAPTTYIPCYWKNSVFHALGTGTDSARVTGIGVSGSLVFCSGYYVSGTDTVACYWDSAASRHDLPDAASAATYGMTYGIVVTNEQPWIVGHYVSSGKNVPCIWYGTTAKAHVLNLPTGYTDADAYAVTIKGSDAEYLYCAGYLKESSTNVPCYWRLDISDEDDPKIYDVVRLTDPDGYGAKACALFASGDDLWIGGDSTNSSSQSVPCYWSGDSVHKPEAGGTPARIACGPDVP
ncbi:MAG TPA: hypothetical protein PLA48_12760 [Holophaga sp.]|nr:hypothetical protein [Holophaga sp.]